MATKTFKSNTVMETLQQVQLELGENAIVVSMREVPLGPLWNPWKKAGVEIIAASPDTSPSPFLRSESNGSDVEFVKELLDIKWESQPEEYSSKSSVSRNLKSIYSDSTPIHNSLKFQTQQLETQFQTDKDREIPPALIKLKMQLIQQGVDPILVENLMDVAIDTLSPATLSNFEICKKTFIELMGTGLRIQKGAGTFLARNVICVIGASGSGKTSVVAKLALYFSQNLRKKVTWICADTVRTGAISEAKAYTDAMGLNLKLVYTPTDLDLILGEIQDTDLFLIDTLGYNPCNESQIIDLGTLLAKLPKRSTYMTIPATTKETDLFQTAAALGMFNIDGLILTKLDETNLFGNVYNFARKNQVPLSFFSTGKEASQDLEIADPERLVAAMLGKNWSK